MTKNNGDFKVIRYSDEIKYNIQSKLIKYE